MCLSVLLQTVCRYVALCDGRRGPVLTVLLRVQDNPDWFLGPGDRVFWFNLSRGFDQSLPGAVSSVGHDRVLPHPVITPTFCPVIICAVPKISENPKIYLLRVVNAVVFVVAPPPPSQHFIMRSKTYDRKFFKVRSFKFSSDFHLAYKNFICYAEPCEPVT
jgi:hypothetical protein